MINWFLGSYCMENLLGNKKGEALSRLSVGKIIMIMKLVLLYFLVYLFKLTSA